MEELIKKIKFSDYQGMYMYLKNSNLTLDEIVFELSKNSTIVNEFLCHYISYSNDIELAIKVADAIDVIEKFHLLEFKKAIENGNYEQYLTEIDWRAKVNLMVKINGLYDDGYSELKKYLSLIEKSLEDDKKNKELTMIVKKLKKQKNEIEKILYPDEFLERK